MRWLVPPVLFSLCVAAMVALRLWGPVTGLVPHPFNWLGMVLIAAGLAVGLSGVWQFHKAHTTVKPFHKPASLVTGGVYRFTRNPMYLGLVIDLCGVWVLLGPLLAAAPVLVFVVVADRWYIRVEERMLADKFGEQFHEYCARTRRWL